MKKVNGETILMISIIVVIGVIYFLEPNDPYLSTGNSLIEVDSSNYPLYPELANISDYINTNPINISTFRGKVVLIDFWSYTCGNCIRSLEFSNELYEKYGDDGLVIIGVHTPKFVFEKDYTSVKNSVDEHNIDYPVVLDNDYSTWKIFGNKYWPRKYLIDANGFVRFDHIGDGNYIEIERTIQKLLGESGVSVFKLISNSNSTSQIGKNTPELYAGYAFAIPRGQEIGNRLVEPGQIEEYDLPEEIKKDKIYLQGIWVNNAEDMNFREGKGVIKVNFKSDSANIVAGSSDEDARVKVFLNGFYISPDKAGRDVKFEDGESFVIIDEPGSYNLFEGDYSANLLELEFTEKGLFFSSLSF